MKAPRILIVEDESIIAMTIEQALQRLGFAVAGATRTGEQAIELTGDLRPDLVLMDIRLAGKMDGIEAAERIRREHEVPVVYLTSHGDTATLERAKVPAPAGYILKPFEERELHIAIEMALYKQRAESQRRRLQRMDSLTQLAGGIAHNFNNMLTVIQGYAGLIKTRVADDALAQEAIAQVQTAGDRAANLTRQLLIFSQRQVTDRRPLDLDRIVAHAVENLRPTLEAASIDYDSGGALSVEADESMIDQLLVQLVANAREAMPSGGRITVTTGKLEITPKNLASHREGRIGRFARLTVRDAGCGMNAETLGQIFDPFFTTKDVALGAGLGLSTVHGIVKQHHGWIEVASEVGAGTTFDIFLPLLSQSQPSAPSPRGSGPVSGQETILLVEDETALRQMVRLFLEAAGYRVVEAETGQSALEIWPECADKVDLVLTDIHMPDGINGRELAEKLSTLKPGLKVILSSGFIANPEDHEFASRMGGSFLQKPYRRSQLLRTVRDCLDSAPVGN
jgi:signal transduction histidine kinase